jgi:hypothetical protein
MATNVPLLEAEPFRLFDEDVVFLPDARATFAKEVQKTAATRHDTDRNFMKLSPFVKTTNS